MRLRSRFRPYFKISILAGIAFFTSVLAGCATGPNASSKQAAESKRIHALEMKFKKQRSILQDLKERNLVLEKRENLRSVNQVVVMNEDNGESIAEPFSDAEQATARKSLPVKLPVKISRKRPSDLNIVPTSILAPSALMGLNLAAGVTPSKAAPSGSAPSVPRPDTDAPAPLAVSSEKTGEHYLYSKILETYRMKKSDEMQKTVELLLKSYPESVFADNAVYISGLLDSERGDLKSALKHFDKLLRDYPRSNKAVAALYAKATIEMRAGHFSGAKRGFIQVRDFYPGSPEAARVSVQLKLLESVSQKHREL